MSQLPSQSRRPLSCSILARMGEPGEITLQDTEHARLSVPADAPQELQQLREQQHRALEQFTLGRGVTAAAREAGVSRPTVYRWLRTDPAFMAALADWRSAKAQLARDRLNGCLDRAAKNVSEAVGAGNVKISLMLLRDAGVLRSLATPPPAPGSPDSNPHATLQMEHQKVRVSMSLPPPPAETVATHSEPPVFTEHTPVGELP